MDEFELSYKIFGIIQIQIIHYYYYVYFIITLCNYVDWSHKYRRK